MMTVKKWDEIRRMYHIEEKSINEIAQETGCAWRTVKKAVDSESPPSYKREKPYRAQKIGPYQKRIEEMLDENSQLPRKQRWTSPRIMEVLQKEGYAGAESTIRHYVAKIRRDKKKPKLFIPLEFDPGTDAQVDWGVAEVILNGVITLVQLFCMKLSYSRRNFVMAFPSQKQESFFLGHVEAFNFFGGVPERISYDNLKTAVKEILKGKKRVEQDQFFHFRGHYLFESHYCTPGAGNEKGRVEHSVGFSRRRFMVPRPEVESYEELNRYLLKRCIGDDNRRVKGESRSIGEMWQAEKPHLRPLPNHRYDCSRTINVSLNRYSQVEIETNRYSVPVDKGTEKLTAKLSPFTIELFKAQTHHPIAVHERCYAKGQEQIDPHHYLPLLRQRPGAFNHAKPVRQWRQTWPACYSQLQEKLQQRDPERGIKTFINILYLHNSYGADEMKRAIETALKWNTLTVESVQLYLTQNRYDPQPPAALEADSLTDKTLQHIGQQPLNVAVYDRVYDRVVEGGS